MTISPMLRHALESFEHGLEHYLDGTERSRKFAILHIDQAIELFLKERVIQAGKSIYKTDGTTLSIHEAFNSLKNEATITERPRLEELHDVRNIIQHKGFLPDQGTTKFYIEIAYEFAKIFLVDELKLSIDQVLSIQHRSLMEGTSIIKDTPTEILATLETVKTSNSPVNKILSAYTLLERAVTILPHTLNKNEKPNFKATLRNAALANGFKKEKFEKSFKSLMIMRGMIKGKAYEPTEKDAEGFIKSVANIFTLIGLTTEDIEI